MTDQKPSIHKIIALSTYAVIIFIVVLVIYRVSSQNSGAESLISDCIGANAFLNQQCDDPGLNGQPSIPPSEVEFEATQHTYPECFIPAGTTDFDRSNCILGAPEESASLLLAVFGDSHARSWLPMLDELGIQENWSVRGYTKSGCTPVPLSTENEATDPKTRDQSKACYDFVLNASDVFEQDQSLDGIIVAAAPTDRNFYLGSTLSTDETVTAMLDKMWAKWENSGKEMIVIGELPHFRKLNSPSCIAQHDVDDISQACSLAAEEIVGTRGEPLTVAAQNAKTPINFYDPTPGTCTKDDCFSMVGHVITRYDAHHLSRDFSRSYKDDFLRFINQKKIFRY